MDWNDVVAELALSQNSGRAVLDLELSRLAEAPGPPILAEGVDALAELCDARTLRDLIESDGVERYLREAFDRSERREFLKALPAAARRALDAAARSAPRAQATPPCALGELRPDRVPEGGAELEAWARRFGVLDTLELPVRVPTGPRARDTTSATVRECVDLTQPPSPRLARLDRRELREAASKMLRERAIANAPLLRARESFLARRRDPEDGWIAERVNRLRAGARARGGGDGERIDLAYPVAKVAFRADPPQLMITPHFAPVAHALALEHLQLMNRSHLWHGTTERAREDRALLECAADALCDPEGAALRDLAAWRAIPAWRHMLGTFENALAARRGASDEPASERLAFRLPADSGEPPVVLVQSARARGASFTVGRQVDAHAALAMPTLSPLERELVETISVFGGGYGYYGARELGRTRLRLFELLAEHPRVFLDGDNKTALRIRRGRTTLRVAGEPPGYRVSVAVGGATLAPVEALRRADRTRVLTALSPDARTLYFAEIDEVATALFAALAAHGDALPAEGLDALLGALATFPDSALDLELPEEARGRAVAADARLRVQLSMDNDGGLALAVRVRPVEGGPALVPGAPPRQVYGAAPDGSRLCATRNLDDEEARAEHLLAELPLAETLRRGPFDLRVDDPERACDVVAALAELGDAIVTEWPEGKRLRVVSTLGPSALKLRIERRHDWFGVNGSADTEAGRVSLHALLEAARSGRRFVRVGDGALAAIGRDLRARLSRADDVLHADREGFAAHAPAMAAVSELVEDFAQLTAVKEWHALRARMKQAETSEPELPGGFAGVLRHYQMDGFRWLMRLSACGTGACLADEMGLGKTLQSLAVLEARRAEGPALVVAPTSVCPNWRSEAARFAPGLRVVEYRGAARAELLASLEPGTVLVTSYDLMVRDIDALAATEFATAIFDEAHALKNGHSKRAAAARRVRAGFRVALTGTPVENHTGELWSLFRVVVPGLFGSWERFRERFAAPIERDRDPARRAALASMIRPYLLRRTKRDVSPELPPRTDIVRFVDLSPAERDLYEAERLRAVEAMKSGGAGEDARFAMLAAITRLRQLACHPRLRNPDSRIASSKLASVIALVDELRDSGHRALVFSQFTSHLSLVAAELTAKGVTFMELDGSTPPEARADRVQGFQAGGAEVFLISLKAGGVGLNLTAADYVLHLDPWWNPAAEDQASDRAHRIGQDKPVTVVRFIARGTIEESVLALHAEKRELAEAVLSGGDVAGRLTTRELLALMERSARPDADAEVPDALDEP